MVFFAVFIASFLTANYLVTGSVTNTWIGIAIITGSLAGIIRWAIGRLIDRVHAARVATSEPETAEEITYDHA